MYSRLEKLQECIQSVPLADYPSRSRVHRLRSFDQTGCSVYVKRDDELGFGLSGSKLRKYLSLMPYLTAQSLDELVIMGPAHSNHLFSMVQLLRENRITPILFFTGRPLEEQMGTFFFTRLMAAPEDIHWLSEEDIPSYVEKRQKVGIRIAVNPMGGSCKEALPGALTLALDILRNERELGVSFDHLLVDAGTGMMAQALILAFSWLQHPGAIHVVQVSSSLVNFDLGLKEMQDAFEALIGAVLPDPPRFSLYRPTLATSYGSINETLMQFIKEIAYTEGILIDPVYNAKLFFEGKRLVKEGVLKGNTLLIHSGGTFSLTGYQKALN